MARVLIDVSAAGDKWLKDALQDLVACPNVKFVYSGECKYRNEVSKNNFLGNFLKLMRDRNRRDDTDPAICSRLVKELNSTQEWVNEDACDDPHIFAIAYQKPDVFVFTSDKRLVKCRVSMNNVLDKRFRAFSTIQSEANYKANAARIKS